MTHARPGARVINRERKVTMGEAVRTAGRALMSTGLFVVFIVCNGCHMPVSCEFGMQPDNKNGNPKNYRESKTS